MNGMWTVGRETWVGPGVRIGRALGRCEAHPSAWQRKGSATQGMQLECACQVGKQSTPAYVPHPT